MSPFRSQLSAYSVFNCIRAVWFVRDGDSDAARDLLEDAAAIGAITSVGYGRATGRKLFDIPKAFRHTKCIDPWDQIRRWATSKGRTIVRMGKTRLRDTCASNNFGNTLSASLLARRNRGFV
jgi:hypothetical protein